AGGQGHDLGASSDEESISTDHDRVSASLSQARESCIDFVLATCCQFLGSQTDDASCSFHLRHFGIGPRIVRIDHHGNGASVGQQFARQFKPLRPHLCCNETCTS